MGRQEIINLYKNITAKQSIQILVVFRFLGILIQFVIGSSGSGNLNTIIISLLVIYFLFNKEIIFFKYIWIFYSLVYLYTVYISFIQPYLTDLSFRILWVPDNQIWYLFTFFDTLIFLVSIQKVYKFNLK